MTGLSKYILGFFAGVIVCLLSLLIWLFYGKFILDRLELCPQLTQAQKIDLIRESATARVQRAGSPHEEFEIVEDGDIVFFKKNGKRIERGAPIVFCGSVEGTSDPDFQAEK